MLFILTVSILTQFFVSLSDAYILPPSFHSKSRSVLYESTSSTVSTVATAPYDDIIPFLSEHIQLSDMLLVVGASTDVALQLSKEGYGTKITGFIQVVDSSEENINTLREMALSDPVLAANIADNRLRFTVAELTKMPEVCKQSCVDAIVDYGGLDSVMSAKGKKGFLKTVDHLQDAVRLGNILVCISKLDKETFCSPFDERFGWVQELDGDPGEISAWYRGKTNIQKSSSNFKSHGLHMYVYTNTDNC